MKRGARHEAYRPSGVPGIPEIPAHWSVVPVCALYRPRKATGFAGETLLSVYRDHGVVPKDSRDDNNNRASDDLSVYQLVEPGDLVTNKMKTWQGSIAVSRHRGIVSPAYFVYESKHGQVSSYLHHLLRSLPFISAYMAASKGVRVNQWDLDPDLFRRFPVLLPPIPEQLQIAEYLDRETARVDALIEKKTRFIELLREKRQALISAVVTKGLDPKVRLVHSGVAAIGLVPEHFRSKRLMHLTAFGRDIMYGIVLPGPDVEGGIPIVKGGNCRLARLKLDLLSRTTPEIEAPYARARLRKNDVVYSIRGSIGDAELVPDELEGANITQDVARVSPAEGIDPKWLLYALQSTAIFSQLDQEATGATIRGINIFSLKRAVVPLPSAEEQTTMARVLDEQCDRVDRLIELTRQSVNLLIERRAALITAAVTGQIDVRAEHPDEDLEPA